MPNTYKYIYTYTHVRACVGTCNAMYVRACIYIEGSEQSAFMPPCIPYVAVVKHILVKHPVVEFHRTPRTTVFTIRSLLAGSETQSNFLL